MPPGTHIIKPASWWSSRADSGHAATLAVPGHPRKGDQGTQQTALDRHREDVEDAGAKSQSFPMSAWLYQDPPEEERCSQVAAVLERMNELIL